jgi:hypothetical protein
MYATEFVHSPYDDDVLVKVKNHPVGLEFVQVILTKQIHFQNR